jgi:hypothetical protein
MNIQETVQWLLGERAKIPSQWSGNVTKYSHAMDTESGIFKSKDPKAIALSLKHSADTSNNLKAEPFQSAMSMLNFYINRAGTKLDPDQRKVLEAAKDELRLVYGRPVKAKK